MGSDTRLSGLVMYSLGIVVKDKLRRSKEIDVYPTEELPGAEGKIEDHKVNHTSNLPDKDNKVIGSKAKEEYVITAEWLPYTNSNRSTAPDVIKNETVMIFRYEDTDEYYWTTLGLQNNIRQRETVRYSFSNTGNALEESTKSNSYWVEYSTHDKYIHLHTNKNDGEPFSYDFKVDTKRGMVEIKDSGNNKIIIVSKSGLIEVNANKDVTVNSPNVTINAPNITLNGNVKCTQDLTVNGNVKMKSTVTSDGQVTSKGVVLIQGKLFASGGIVTSGCQGC